MEREDTERMVITLPKSMGEALRRQSKKHKVPMAAYIRYALEQQLKTDGENVRDDVLWGGARYSPPSEDDQPGEVLAVAVG